jgi:hypothetical protein
LIRSIRGQISNLSPYARDLPLEDRKIIGTDIKEVQFGWPLGIPLLRKANKSDTLFSFLIFVEVNHLTSGRAGGMKL